MNIKRITNLKELARFTPKLVELHANLDGQWEPDSTPHEFLLQLIDNFEEKSYYFGELAPNGDLIYFVAIIEQNMDSLLFWLFYVNKDYRAETRQLLFNLKAQFKGKGYNKIYSQSTRTERSYERWLNKFGAEKVAIVYKFNL